MVGARVRVPDGAKEDPDGNRVVRDGIKEALDGTPVDRDGTRAAPDGTREDLAGAKVDWEEAGPMEVVMPNRTITYNP